MAGSGTELFSSDDEVLQTSCSSYSEPGSEDDRSNTQFKNLEMADLFKAKTRLHPVGKVSRLCETY